MTTTHDETTIDRWTKAAQHYEATARRPPTRSATRPARCRMPISWAACTRRVLTRSSPFDLSDQLSPLPGPGHQPRAVRQLHPHSRRAEPPVETRPNATSEVRAT